MNSFKNDQLQVADFGLARIYSDTDTHVSTRVMGTFGYAFIISLLCHIAKYRAILVWHISILLPLYLCLCMC